MGKLTLRIVAPFAPGGTTDLIFRLATAPLAQALGQPIVQDNKPDAGGLLDAEAAVRPAGDRHPLLMTKTSPLRSRYRPRN